MSETIKSEYKNVGKQTFEIRIYYNLGGINYFTNRNEARGYYLSITPVKINKSNYKGNEISCVKFTGCSGIKDLLLEVKRKSKKAETLAISKATDKRINELITYVINKENIAI